MYRQAVFTLTLFALIFGACTGPREAAGPALPEAFPGHTAAQIEALIAPSDTLHALRGKVSMLIDTPERGGQFTGELRARRADSLYLTISPGLGIEAARALVTPDSFFVYDRIQGRLLFGAVADAASALPFLPTGDDAFYNLLGLPALDIDGQWSVTADDTYYYLASPDGTHLLTVDPARWRIVRYEQHDGDGGLVEERIYSEFDRFGSLYLPRRVLFRRPKDKTTLSLYYRELSLNPGDLSFTLRVRDDVRRVAVDR